MLGLSPILAIFLVGTAISIFTSLINKKFLGTEKAKEVKKRMQEVRDKMLGAQKSGDTRGMNEYMKEMMKINSEYMKFTIKPMIISIILVIAIFPFVRNAYTGIVVATVPETLPVIGGFELSWFWWYFLSTFIVSIIMKKILEI